MRRSLSQSLSAFTVVWTKQAECEYSGLPHPCTLTTATENKMRNLIELAVMTTPSCCPVLTLRYGQCVHTVTKPTRSRAAARGQHWQHILRVAGDGHMDDVHGKRSLYGADLVHMIAASRGSCGVGYVGPTSRRMFSIPRYSCPVSNFSVGMSNFTSGSSFSKYSPCCFLPSIAAHELAHNLGAHHDRGTLKPMRYSPDLVQLWFQVPQFRVSFDFEL